MTLPPLDPSVPSEYAAYGHRAVIITTGQDGATHPIGLAVGPPGSRQQVYLDPGTAFDVGMDLIRREIAVRKAEETGRTQR